MSAGPRRMRRWTRWIARGAVPMAVIGASAAGAQTVVDEQTDLRSMSRTSLSALQDLNGGAVQVATGDAGAGVGTVMSLSDAVELGYARSYAIAAADAGYDVARAQRSAAMATFLPQFSARLATGIERSTPASIVNSSTGKVVPVDTHRRQDLLVTIAQPVFDWSAIGGFARTVHLRDVAAADARDARDQEGLGIAQAYFALIQAGLGYQILQDHYGRLLALQQWMKRRVAGGGASVADGQQVEGRVLATQSLLEQQKAAREQAAIAFEQLTGRRPGQVIIPAAMADGAPASLDEALARAIQANPGLAGLEANERASRSEHAAALGGYLPRLSVEISKSGAENAGGDPGWRRDRRIMAVASWSLSPLGGVANAQIAAAKARQYRYQRLDQQRSVEQAVRVAFSALGTVRIRVETAQQELVANSEVVRSFDEQFTAGRKSLLELLDAYERLYQARQTMLSAGLSGMQLYFQTLRVMGELSPSLSRAARKER